MCGNVILRSVLKDYDSDAVETGLGMYGILLNRLWTLCVTVEVSRCSDVG